TAGADVTIEDLAIVNGQAEIGGGLLNEGGRVTLADVGMASNRAIAEAPGASAFGGAIAVMGDGASLVVDTCTIVYNEAVGARGEDGGSGLVNGAGGDGRGGGIYAGPGTTVQIQASLFGGNQAVGGRGGDEG